MYLDGDADLRIPQTTTAGNFDGTVIAALLGEGDPDYAGLAGPVANAATQRLSLLGYGDSLVLTEVNPTHDPGGELLDRYLDGVTAALIEPARNS